MVVPDKNPHQITSHESTKITYLQLENVNKADLHRLAIHQLPKEKPDFYLPGASKDTLIAEWLKDWITAGLEDGSLIESNLLPRKSDIAEYLGVSVGTVQNAIRYVEDDGFVESKQRIGTLIRRPEASTRMRKQTSKRDQAVSTIKQYIVDNGYQPEQFLPSAREVAKQINSAPNTTRLALEYLASLGILESMGTRGNKANWLLKQLPEVQEADIPKTIESETLIDHLERDLKRLIAAEYNIHDKLPSHLELSDMFKVSIKTIHDAMKRLGDQGIIQSKRGRYGTYILRKPTTTFFELDDVFVPVDDLSFYNYEKVEHHLKLLIAKNHKIGDKLPSMGQLSETLDVSSNTIRKALQNLSQQSLVAFSRGRYGGTFVTAIPDVSPTEVEASEDSNFTWVSINPESLKTYRNKSVG